MQTKEGGACLFVCNKYPMLTMIYKKDSTAIINGEVIRSPLEQIGFVKTPYGGHFETNDQEKISFIRKSPQFLEGLIVEVENIEEMRKGEPQPESHPVMQGGVGTMAREPKQAEPPKESAPEPVAAAVVPGRKKKAF